MIDPILTPHHPATLRFVFPADFPSARAAAAAVRNFLAAQGVPAADLFTYELCVAEACNNSVEYADPPRTEHRSLVEAVCTGGEIELRVTDHTAGFDWPTSFTTPPVQSERGRGLFIIHSFMDEVHYLRGPKENLLVMRKQRRGLPATPPPGTAEPTLADCQGQLAESRRAVAATARELSFRTETLSAVFRCCAELGRAGTSAGFEVRLLADLLHLTSADWYVLRFVTPDRRQLAVAAVSAPALQAGALDVPGEGDPATSLEGRAAASRATVRFDARDCAATEPLRAAGAEANGVVYPLYFSDTLVGTVAVGRRSGNFAFNDLPEDVGRTLADFLAIQTAGLRHQAEDLRAKLYTRELDIARVIQRSLLPVSLPQMPGFGLAGGWHSAREIGGDFYDAIALNEHASLLMVADVMGKGVPAALFATNLRGLLRGLSASFDDPAQLLRRLNRLLYEELSAVSMFITAQVAVVDVRTRTVTAAGAGHGPLLYTAGDGTAGVVEELAPHGMPLGILPDVEYRSRTVTLGRPGTLLLHTDGLIDMRNIAGECFGQQRLVTWLGENNGRGRSATELRGRLASELTRYRGDAAMADDQAFLLLTEERVENTGGGDGSAAAVRTRRGALAPTAG